MCRARYGLSFLFTLSVGCGSSLFLEAPEPPEAIRYLGAVVLESTTGAFRGASAIVPREAQWSLSIEGVERDLAATTVLVLGWDDKVMPSELRAESGLELGTMREAVGCETHVPAPIWQTSTQGETPETLPPLTTDRLANHCPTFSAPGQTEYLHNCGQTFCGQTIEQRGCALNLGVGACGLGLGTIEAKIDAYGALCVPAASGCSVVEATAPAFRSLECGSGESCRLDWIRPSSSGPPLSILRKDLIDITLPAPGGVSAEPFAAQYGPLQEMLLREDEVLVLARDGDPEARFGAPDLASRLVRLDASTLDVLGEHPLPVGTGAFALAPDGGSLVAVQIDPTGAVSRLLRLSLSGEVQEAFPFAEPLSGPERMAAIFRDMPELDAFVLIAGDSATWTKIMSFHRNTLETLTACRPEFDMKASDALAIEPDELWVAENADDYLVRIALDTCESTGSMSTRTPGNFGMGFLHRRSSNGSIQFTVGGVVANSIVTTELISTQTFPTRGASFYESFMAPTLLLEDPSRPGLALVGVHSARATESARLAWFDLEAQLLLPGSIEIGYGMVSRIRTRGDGVFYLLMGRSGGVVKVSTE